jgi:formamidopyrimidine-DNA glycosylase
MPELPDIELYLHALRLRVIGNVLQGVRLASPFVLRSVDPPIDAVVGKRVLDVRRLGKRVVLVLQDDLYIVLHLMIAGRLRWKPAGQKIPGRVGLGAFDFEDGTLLLTEASKKKRAALYLCRGQDALLGHDPGGIEPLETGYAGFRDALLERNHTVKRALTDPRIFSGIGNAYSDEILHRRQRFPREGDRVSSRDGGARQIRRAMPGLRRSNPANRLCGSRNQLLRNLPDRWEAARRSRAFEVAQGGLASFSRRARITAPRLGAL